MQPSRLGSHLLVHLNLLKENVQALKEKYPNNKILFMVKADGYGHGLLEVVKYSFEECGISEFGVASVGEALSIRRHLPEHFCELYVFSDLQLQLGQFKSEYLDNRIIPVLHNWQDLKIFLDAPEFAQAPLCLKFNTGMNRLGLPFEEAEEVADLLVKKGRKDVFHLMSHFANASMPMDSNKRNVWQRERFENIKEAFTSRGVTLEKTSLANSGALEQGVGAEDTHIRPGLMLYGPTSMAPQHRGKSWWKGNIISELKTSVLRSFEVAKGDPLGYGSIPAPEEGTVAIIALGYGDGISTFYRNAPVYHNGVKGKFVGRVCMDMAFLLFPKGTPIKQGDSFILWSEDSQHFMEIADTTNILPYELVIQLTSRVPRIYQIN